MASTTAEAAFAEMARLLAEAREDQAATARAYGPRAVAEAAYRPGGPSVDEIEATYLRLVRAAHRKPAPEAREAA